MIGAIVSIGAIVTTPIAPPCLALYRDVPLSPNISLALTCLVFLFSHAHLPCFNDTDAEIMLPDSSRPPLVASDSQC